MTGSTKVFVVGSAVYAATNGGLSISTDDGATFINKTTADGLGSNIVNAVSASGGIIYAGTNLGFSFGTGTAPGDPTVVSGGSVMVTPTSGPNDNGTIATFAVRSQGTYTGTISVNKRGRGFHQQRRACRNTYHHDSRHRHCGDFTDATFTLIVQNPFTLNVS